MADQGRERTEGGTTTESFAYKYRRLTTDAAASVRLEALGSTVPNGYTTGAQADRIAAALEVGQGHTLLDLGSGRGWPGTRVASVTGCTAIVADLPLDALRHARQHLADLGSGAGGVVAADGLHLPFRDRSFDAACHTDVLC